MTQHMQEIANLRIQMSETQDRETLNNLAAQIHDHWCQLRLSYGALFLYEHICLV